MNLGFNSLCIVNLEKKIDKLFIRIDTLKTEVSSLKEDNTVLKTKNSSLENKVDFLENRLQRKNSSNRSIPPSKDVNRVRPNQSLREKKGKKSGGQKGHAGITLKMQDKVDNVVNVVNHKKYYCSCCREKLFGGQVLLGRRQVFVIP